MKKVFWISLIVLVAFVAAAWWLGVFSGGSMRRETVSIRDANFLAEVADTPVARGRGLSGRESLAPAAAMLFIFPKTGSYGFWMKDMHFPLDLVWINGDTIVGIEKNVDPQIGASMFSLKTYYPPAPVDKVLEINGGLADKYGLQAGDKARFEPEPPQALE